MTDKSPAKPSSAAKKKSKTGAAGGSGAIQTTLPGASPVKPSASGKQIDREVLGD